MQDLSDAQASAIYGASRVWAAIYAAIGENLGKDLDLAAILFAVILRTQVAPDETEALTERRGVQVASLTTTIYETAKVTGLNRATVRRKMFKLADMGLITRIDEDRWMFGQVSGKAPPAAMRIATAIRTAILDASEQMASLPTPLPGPATFTGSAERAARNVALTKEEALRKIGKGAFLETGESWRS